MVQIAIMLFGCYFIWEGAKGFRECGIQFGIARNSQQPLPQAKGQLVGGIAIAFGAAMDLA